MENDIKKLNDNSLIFIYDLYKSYGHKLILDNIDLAISPGEFVTIVGPSGCGKSTLLRLAVGQEFPDHFPNTVFAINGEELGLPDPTRGIVYQKYPLFPHLTVFENVMQGICLPLNFFKRFCQRKEIKKQTMQYLEYVGLADSARKYPQELSGGMQQRVAIAQALLANPKILLMDEPFGALDPGIREDMQVLLLELWEKHKMTILFVTHDVKEAVFLGTRIIVVSKRYIDDRGPNFPRGAKIIYDKHLKSKAPATTWKSTQEFAATVKEIETRYFETDYTPHVEKFDLRHPNSFQHLQAAESGEMEINIDFNIF